MNRMWTFASFLVIVGLIGLLLFLAAQPRDFHRNAQKAWTQLAGPRDESPSSATPSFHEPSPTGATDVRNQPEGIQRLLRSRILSEKTKAEFFEKSFVEAKFPDYFPFEPIELDLEHITGIYARSSVMDVAVLAGRVDPTDAEVVEYLSSEGTGIPNLDQAKVLLEPKSVSVPAVPGSGMRAGRYWRGRLSNGDGVRVGLMPRADGKGSYLVVFTGKESNLEDYDDFYEELYGTFKAKAAP